jgi:polar amino acid transport system substrate-binding protein
MQSQLRIFLVTGLTLFCLTPLLCQTPSVSAETLKGIRQRGRMIVAVKDNTRPLGFKDRAGRLQGLEIDIAQRLGTEILGQSDRVDLTPVNNQDRLQVLFDRKVDVTIARLGVNRGRSRVVEFSQPYYQDGTGILTNSSKVRKLADLAGQPVAVIQSSVSAYPLADQVSGVALSGSKGVKLVPVSSYEAAKRLLDEGNVVAFAADYSLLVGWMQEFPQGYRLLAEKLNVESLAIAMPKGLQHRELREFVIGALDRWKKEGWLQERIRYWGL